MEIGRRLTIFSGTWYPQEGGAEKQLRQVSAGLVGFGWQVSIIAGHIGDPALASDPSGDVSVERVRVPDYVGPANRLAARPSVLTKSIGRGVRSRPDVVLASLLGTASTAAIAVSRLARCPLVLRVGGNTAGQVASSPVRRAGAEFLIRSSDIIVANAPHLLDQIGHLPSVAGTELVVIRNGVDVGDPDKVANAAAQARKGPPRVIYYTNGTPAKNDSGFVDLVSRCPAIRFRAVGRTQGLPDLPNLERRGWVEGVAEEVGWADVVLNTSSFEGSPNFCMQGLEVGRPVVGYANPGLVDMQRSWPHDVHLVPFGHACALAEVLAGRDWRKEAVTGRPPTIAEAAEEWDAVLSGLVGGIRA